MTTSENAKNIGYAALAEKINEASIMEYGLYRESFMEKYPVAENRKKKLLFMQV